MFLGLLLFSLAAAEPLSDTEKDEGLRAHNLYRCMHGAQPVTWNSAVADAASEYGHNLNALVHGNTYELSPPAGPTGENLAFESPTLNIADSVGRWYQEVEECEGGPTGFTDGCEHGHSGAMVGHFTAVVWLGVQQIGCGLSASREILVCRYWSGDTLSEATANIQGSYVSQVQHRSRTSDECSGVVASGPGVDSVNPGDVEASPTNPSPAADPATATAAQKNVSRDLVEAGPFVCYDPARYRLSALTAPDAANCSASCDQQDVCTRYAFKADQSCDTLPSNCFLYQQDESGSECVYGRNSCYLLTPKAASISNLVKKDQERAVIRRSKPKRQVAIGSQGLATDRDEEFPAPTDAQESSRLSLRWHVAGQHY